MENSPLRFLDYDVSQMLCEEVRLSQEKEAIKFHDYLFHYGEKLNKQAHDLIVQVYYHEHHLLNYENREWQRLRLAVCATNQWASITQTCSMIKNSYERYIKNTNL